MSELKPCPCGKIPTGLGIGGESAGGKWAEVSGHCCGEWKIEFRTGYHSLDSPEVIAAAMEAWSNAPRGESQRIAKLQAALKEAEDMLDRAAKTIAQLNLSSLVDNQERLDMSFRCMEMAHKAREVTNG